MLKFYLLVFSFFSVVFLSGCKQELSYDYLMAHPHQLNRLLASCQMGTDTYKQDQQCKIAVSAATQFAAIVDEVQQDPEKLGERVLKLEMAYAKEKQVLHDAQQKLTDLTLKKAPQLQIQAAQNELKAALKTSHDMQQELRVLLAVVSLAGPQ